MTSNISDSLLFADFDLIISGRNGNPDSLPPDLLSLSPPSTITSPSVTEIDVDSSRFVSVGELLTPVVVLTKFETCCITTKSIELSRICGVRSNIIPDDLYCTDWTAWPAPVGYESAPRMGTSCPTVSFAVAPSLTLSDGADTTLNLLSVDSADRTASIANDPPVFKLTALPSTDPAAPSVIPNLPDRIDVASWNADPSLDVFATSYSAPRTIICPPGTSICARSFCICAISFAVPL